MTPQYFKCGVSIVYVLIEYIIMLRHNTVITSFNLAVTMVKLVTDTIGNQGCIFLAYLPEHQCVTSCLQILVY